MNLEALNKLPVALLLGGDSPEREVSLNSGSAVQQALLELGADVRPVDTAQANWLQQLHGVELAFIALHGADGENGTVQGALQTLGIPYTGSGVLGSALAMDKLRSKRLWRGIGLPTAEFAELHADSNWAELLETLGPVFVKPATGGSSIATAAARSAAELQAAWQAASEHGRVIAERLIDGDEYTVAVLGDSALPAIRMETDNEFYDYEAKYLSDDTRYICPCGLPADEESALAELAVQAFDSLDCEIWGRVDFMRDGSGEFFILEVNTVPGMTDHSLVPMAASTAGMDMPALVGRIAALSLERG